MMCNFNYVFLSLFFNYGVCGLSLPLLGEAPSSSTKSVSAAFLDAKISPKYIPTPPERYLNVVFGDKVVDLGNGLSSLDVVLAPTVTWDADPDLYYTFMFIDLDALYPGLLKLPGTWLHWGRYDIKGGNMGSGKDFASYMAPTTPPGSKSHRYVLVVYVQPGLLQMDAEDFVNTKPPARYIFDNQYFVTKHKLCGPHFGNYYLGKILYTDITQ